MSPLAKVHRDAARLGYIDARQPALPEAVHPRTLVRHLRRIGWQDDVELLLAAGRHVRARDGICVHNTADLGAIRRLSAQGVWVANTVRAIADHARHTGASALCRAIADAERGRHCTLRQVGEELERRVRFPGKAGLRRAHGELSGELNHSGYERLGRRLLRHVGVTVASRPGPVVHRQRVVAEVDRSGSPVRWSRACARSAPRLPAGRPGGSGTSPAGAGSLRRP